MNLKYSEDDSSSEEEPKNSLSSIRNLPERYIIREDDGKRILICLEAPNIKVQVEAGLDRLILSRAQITSLHDLSRRCGTGRTIYGPRKTNL